MQCNGRHPVGVWSTDPTHSNDVFRNEKNMTTITKTLHNLSPLLCVLDKTIQAEYATSCPQCQFSNLGCPVQSRASYFPHISVHSWAQRTRAECGLAHQTSNRLSSHSAIQHQLLFRQVVWGCCPVCSKTRAFEIRDKKAGLMPQIARTCVVLGGFNYSKMANEWFLIGCNTF